MWNLTLSCPANAVCAGKHGEMSATFLKDASSQVLVENTSPMYGVLK